VLIDCFGRYNETVVAECDSNHLEPVDGHQGWEWREAFDAIAGTVLQPCSRPHDANVRSFLFHGFDAEKVLRSRATADEAVIAWSQNGSSADPYDLVYVGNNFQKWTQLRPLLDSIEQSRQRLRVCLVGRDWAQRPKWAAAQNIAGIDVDSSLLKRIGAELRPPVSFEEVIECSSQGRFCPVIHRPSFNALGLVTARTFDTFCADAIPLLLLPAEFVEEIYGPDALPLTLHGDVIDFIERVKQQPHAYWNAVLKTRAHLAAHHSYTQRWRELLAILNN
jgi:hypothetical protein